MALDGRAPFLGCRAAIRGRVEVLEFLDSQRALIEATNERARQAVERFDFEWFERSYGPHQFQFRVVPALLNGPSSYGVSMINAGLGGEIYSLIGVSRSDADGIPELGTPLVFWSTSLPTRSPIR